MNKNLLIGLVVAIVILGGGAYLVTQQAATTSTGSNASSAFKQSKACDLFTLSEAKQVLGQSSVQANIVNTDESTSDVAVTTCTYNNSDSSVTATALVRSGLSSAGVSSSKAGFDQTKSTDMVTAVNGLGDMAYYDTTLGQLSVINGNNWLLISSGGLMPQNHSQAQATQIAQAMLAKL